MSVATRPATQLDLAMERVRLLLRRRMLWLRAWWGEDPLAGAGALVVSDARADALARGPELEAEAAFHREHEGAAELTEAIAQLERRLGAEPAGATPLDRLIARFGLGAFERDLLVLALAPEADPSFGRLYAYVADDAGARHATPRLAFELLGESDARRASLAGGATLRRLRLLVLDEAPGAAWADRPLRMEERVLDHLRGEDRPDARVADLLAPCADPLPAGEPAAIADRVADLLAARDEWPVVHLAGAARHGAASVARAAASRIGLGLAVVPGRAAARIADEPALAQLLEREAALLGVALVCEEEAAGLAGQLSAPVFVTGEEPPAPEVPVLTVPLPVPGPADRRAAWTGVLGDAIDAAAVEALAEQFDLGPRAMLGAVDAAAVRAALRGGPPGPPTAEDLWAACRDAARSHADGGLACPVAASVPWAQLVLPGHALGQLEELAAQAGHRTRVYEDWGFAARLGRGRGITALFAGASGTGKTLAAEALATRLELDLVRIDLAGVVSKWIGETEKHLRAVFDSAEHSGAVLFFDEADALFGKRTEVKDAHDRYANIEVDYLLQRMEDYRGIAILATNRRSLIDPAFLRRLRFLVDFPFPGPAARQRLWAGAFPPEAPIGELDLELLARLELSGGSIRTVAVNAAFLAAAEDRAIEMAHVVHAAQREYAKLEKPLEPAHFGSRP